MSYILEALRKADAERERGSVPDLHAQLLPPGTTEPQVEAPRGSLLPWLAVGVLLAIVAGGAWFIVGRGTAVTVAVAPPVQPVAASAAAPAASAAAAAASAAPAVSTPEPVAAPPPRPAAKTTAARRPPAVARANPAPKPAPIARAAAPTRQAETPIARLPALAELPGELRQLVPPMVIGGSVYSPQASARMVIVNGQVFQEGGLLAPELKLEQVRQKAAVFSIRGQLFEVPF